MKINEVICIHELKKLELREEKQQLNEVFFLAALPWLLGAGLTAYDYYSLKDKEGSWDPREWSKASQAELGLSVAGSVAGGVIGKFLGKGLAWGAGKAISGLAGAGAGAVTKLAAKKAATKIAKKVAAKNRSTDTVAAGRRDPGGKFMKGSNVKGTLKTPKGGAGAAIGIGAKAGLKKGLGKAKSFKKSGKWTKTAGALAGVIAGREAGKELGSLAGLYSRDDKDGKGANGKAKSDWWTSQQAKHKTGTRQATSSIPKPIPKPEFAHEYPELAK